MQKVEFVPLMLTENSDIYSIRVNDDKDSEFRKFIVLFKDSEDTYLRDDLCSSEYSLNTLREQSG